MAKVGEALQDALRSPASRDTASTAVPGSPAAASRRSLEEALDLRQAEPKKAGCLLGALEHVCCTSGGVVMYKAQSAGCDCAGWVRTALLLRGRPVMHMMPPLSAVMLVALLKALALETSLLGRRYEELRDLGFLKEGYALLMIPLSFLLVYRLNRSAVRFYDARAAAGKIIEICRVLAGEAVSYCAHDLDARDELCRWVVAFPVATRNFLRLQDPDPLLDLEGVLSEEDARALQKAPVQTLLCCDRMRAAALRAIRSNTLDHPAVTAVQLQKMEDNISILTGAMGAMERINNTPLPFAYVAHLRTCLVFYLLGLPLALNMPNAWITMALVYCIAFGLLGVEAAAVACERPFYDQQNHLPMDVFASVVADNVLQILRQAHPEAAASPKVAAL